ncbi:MAG: class I SAM-dependent methyltransferase [Nitrospirota bacterium]
MMVCPSYLSFILYNPIRKALTDREKVLDESAVTPASVVLEVGAGNGFLTEAIAGRAKKVYAVELQAGMIRKLSKRMRRFGDKVEIIRCDIAACSFDREPADVVMLYYVFHEVSDQPAAAVTIVNSLKTEGVVSIYEPTVEVRRAAFERTIRLFEEAGCTRELERHGAFTRFVRLRKQRGH